MCRSRRLPDAEHAVAAGPSCLASLSGLLLVCLTLRCMSFSVPFEETDAVLQIPCLMKTSRFHMAAVGAARSGLLTCLLVHRSFPLFDVDATAKKDIKAFSTLHHVPLLPLVHFPLSTAFTTRIS